METNPQLMTQILKIVNRQIKNNDPPITRQTFDRLIAAGCQPGKALEKIALVLVEDILNAMHGKVFDEQDYGRRLRGLK